MSKQIEFNVEYSPEHDLAAEKAIAKPASFEITSESIRTVQNVGALPSVLIGQLFKLIDVVSVEIFQMLSTASIALFLHQSMIVVEIAFVRVHLSISSMSVVESIGVHQLFIVLKRKSTEELIWESVSLTYG